MAAYPGRFRLDVHRQINLVIAYRCISVDNQVVRAEIVEPPVLQSGIDTAPLLFDPVQVKRTALPQQGTAPEAVGTATGAWSCQATRRLRPDAQEGTVDGLAQQVRIVGGADIPDSITRADLRRVDGSKMLVLNLSVGNHRVMKPTFILQVVLHDFGVFLDQRRRRQYRDLPDSVFQPVL